MMGFMDHLVRTCIPASSFSFSGKSAPCVLKWIWIHTVDREGEA